MKNIPNLVAQLDELEDKDKPETMTFTLKLPGAVVGIADLPDTFLVTMPVEPRDRDVQHMLAMLAGAFGNAHGLPNEDYGVLESQLEMVLLQWEVMDHLKKSLKVVAVK